MMAWNEMSKTFLCLPGWNRYWRGVLKCEKRTTVFFVEIDVKNKLEILFPVLNYLPTKLTIYHQSIEWKNDVKPFCDVDVDKQLINLIISIIFKICSKSL